MGQKTFAISPERAEYFSDIDTSILKWSVDLGRAVLHVESLEETLSTIYRSRQKNMIAALSELGLDPAAVAAAKLGPDGSLVVDMVEAPPAPDVPPA